MDLIETYIEYVRYTEPPTAFHRWVIIDGIATLIGRKARLPFGMFTIYPNLYVMLVGNVGTRKSTAIKILTGLMAKASYTKFASRKTSKEKFLMDLQGIDENGKSLIGDEQTIDDIQNSIYFNEDSEPREILIAADEFNEFITGDRLEFYSMLGDLWDWNEPNRPYTSRIKNSKTGGVSIYQPTINIIAGNTVDSFARAFPPEIIGQGFLSRLLIIYSEPSTKKFHIPPIPSKEETEAVVMLMERILNMREQEIKIDPVTVAKGGLLDRIYRDWSPLEDPRFASYSTRRYTQLLRLCIVLSCSDGTFSINDKTVIRANTYLAAAERNMSRALGEFGKAKDSDVSNKIVEIIRAQRDQLIPAIDIYRKVRNDVESLPKFHDLLNKLVTGLVIQPVRGKINGYVLRKNVSEDPEFIDWSLLTEEEKGLL